MFFMNMQLGLFHLGQNIDYGQLRTGTEYFNAKESNSGLKKIWMISVMICTQLCGIKGECVLDEYLGMQEKEETCMWSFSGKVWHDIPMILNT
jgi:hypothetical protein